MLDPLMRRLIDPPLNGVAPVWPRRVSANQITIFGLALGVVCFLAIAVNAMTAALVLLALNRLADGLDGAVARARTPSELGAYLDIVSDVVLWGLLPIGFIILDSNNAVAAAVLLSSFSMSMTVFSPSRLWPKSAGWKPTRKEAKVFLYCRPCRGHGDHRVFRHCHHLAGRVHSGGFCLCGHCVSVRHRPGRQQLSHFERPALRQLSGVR